MSPEISEGEAAAFAAIVDRLGGRRRLRRGGLAAGFSFLAVPVAVELFLLRSPWAAVVSFVITFVVGLATGLLVVARRFLPESR